MLITFGDDFRYHNAERWFSNLDKLIEVVNKEHPDVNLFYSSPHCYIKAIKELKPKLEVRSHDYFPLWTGFYSSRPEVKYLDRYSNQLLQVAKQLEVLAELNNTQSFIFEAKNQLGVLQVFFSIVLSDMYRLMFKLIPAPRCHPWYIKGTCYD